MKTKYIILLFCLCLPIPSMAQFVVKGIVYSSSDKLPLLGATVTEVDASNRFIAGTTTDIDGNFQLKVSSKNALLRFSYIGFTSKDIRLKGEKSLEVYLDDDSQVLTEVVITGETKSNNGMMPISERDMSTSVSKLNMQSVQNVAATSIGELMQGRMSGVDITSISGDPGAGMSIRVRGTSSLNANAEPLIVVDGVPYETKIDPGINFATATEEEYGAMLDISPADIASIEVLKDAAAAAVWGSQGANGVLIITTKRGTKGRTRFNYDAKLTSSWEPNSIPMLNGYEYAMLQAEALFNARGIVSIPNEIAYDKSWYNYHNYAQNTDWMKELTQTAFTHEHNFSLTGGGEKARYRAAIAYLNQKGTTINTYLKRLTARVNMDYDLSDKMRFSTDLAYTNMSNNRTYDNLRSRALTKAPNMAVYEMDENGNPTDKFFAPYSNYQGIGDTYFNPVALANDGFNRLKTNRIVTKLSLRYLFIPEVLQWQADVAFDFVDNETCKFFPKSASGASWDSEKMNTISEKDDEGIMTQTFNKLIYTPKLSEKHRLTALAMFSTYEKSNVSMSAGASNTPLSEIDVISSDVYLKSLQAQKSKVRQLSYLASMNYVLLDRYIASAGVRVDGDSRFGADSRWGVFPSVSLAWRVSSEPFARNWNWLTDFKLKASYGENGTPPSAAYGHFSKFGASGSYLGQGSIVPLNIQLSNLKWETVIQSNIGVDYGFWDNRISGSFEIYKKRTKDAIFTNVKLPSTSGFATLDAQNWGTIDNNGWEFFVTANLFRNKDWNIDLNLNLAQNKNVIVKIPDDYDNEKYSYGNGQYARRVEEGKPIGSIYGYRYLGVYKSEKDAVVKDATGNVVIDVNTNEPLKMRPKLGRTPFAGGDAIYEDIDKNGVIDEHDIVYLGDSNPLLTGGFGPSIRYKNFSLSAFFHFKYDFDVVNDARMKTENMYTKDNQSTATLRRWKKEGDITDIPRPVLNGGYNWLGSDRFVEDASFLRLKTLSLAYTFDSKKIEKLHLKSLKLYLTAYNLFTWTKYTGQDPEIYLSGGDPFAIAMDYSKTPPSKTFTFGLNVSF